MTTAFLFLFGLVLGSFLNVCIHRLPRHESVVTPRSRCPYCRHRIAAYDNLPLLSYLLLRGRCRHCQARISAVYFFVELSTGLLFVFFYSRFGLTAAFAKSVVLGALLLALTVTDWQERLLPDAITKPGMVLGLLFSQIVPVNDGLGRYVAHGAGLEQMPLPLESLLDSLLGAGFGSGLLYFLGEAWKRLRGREAMGFGDVKMMALVGSFLGPKLALLTIFLSSLVGSVIGLGLVICLVTRPSYYQRMRRRFRQISGLRLYFILVLHKQGRFTIPYGCFLAVGAFVSAIGGKGIVQWYLGLAG